MSLQADIRKIIKILEDKKIQYALAGGMVASFYRKQPRTTYDLDFLIWRSATIEKKCDKILRQLDLGIAHIRKAQLEGGPMFAIKNKSSPVWIISGKKEYRVGIDFLLPLIPWVEEALQRSRFNKIDFGFGAIPCITLEDFVISKCFAFYNQSTRFKDLDDLQSVFEEKKEMDLAYLKKRMEDLKIKFPEQILSLLPKELK